MRLRLILADEDRWYIDSFANYIRSVYSAKFTISVFTRMDKLLEHLAGESMNADILLICRQFYTEAVRETYCGFTAILEDGSRDADEDGQLYINKYQPADEVIRILMDACSDSIAGIDTLVKGAHKTTIITVFSPQGGSGCTVLSVFLAHCIAKRGARVLHLDLGNAPAVEMLGEHMTNASGLSEILYHLSSGSKKLAVKIDALKCFSRRWGFYYFNPVNCIMELAELHETGIKRLVSEIKRMGQFDYVVVGADSTSDEKSLTAVRLSDKGLIILEKDALCHFKFERFKRDLFLIDKDSGNCIPDNWVIVYNKCRKNGYRNEPDAVSGIESIEIPYCDDIFLKDGQKYLLNPSGKICAFMDKLADMLYRGVNKYDR